jgi:carbonic anhydrase
MIFDQRIGDIFVVRVAGNVASDEAVGSIEYALKHLTIPRSAANAGSDDLPSSKIVVVLGHQDCGAVKAALDPNAAHDMIPSILNRIYPAVRNLKPDPKDPAVVDAAVRANIDLAAQTLPRYSPVVRDALQQGVSIQGAYFSFANGRVTPQPALRTR